MKDHGGWSFECNHQGGLLVPDFPNYRQKVFPVCPSSFVAIVVSYMASLRLFVQELRIIAKAIRQATLFCPAIRERHGESRARRVVASPAAKKMGNLQKVFSRRTVAENLVYLPKNAQRAWVENGRRR